jgi:ABC-type phosphate/phosphonate transport system substrate-binding protein
VRTASLPWYDLPELETAHDRFWHALAERLRAAGLADVPDTLDRHTPYEQQWRSAGLLLSQACGLDARVAHANRLRLVATPVYDVPGCSGPLYRSHVVVRADDPAQQLEDLRSRACAVNGATSWSGMGCLEQRVLPLAIAGRFFAAVRVTGAHEASLDFVRTGRADLAAIDCVTFGLLQRLRPPAVEGLRILETLAPAPAPPFVTRSGASEREVERLRAALGDAVESEGAALSLVDVRALPLSAYDPMAERHEAAEAAGYTELRAARRE